MDSKKAHSHSKKLVDMHKQVLAITEAHGRALGQLHAASEKHASHVQSQGTTKEHHLTAAQRAEEVARMAREVKRTAMAQAAMADKIIKMAEGAAHSHATVRHTPSKMKVKSK